MSRHLARTRHGIRQDVERQLAKTPGLMRPPSPSVSRPWSRTPARWICGNGSRIARARLPSVLRIRRPCRTNPTGITRSNGCCGKHAPGPPWQLTARASPWRSWPRGLTGVSPRPSRRSSRRTWLRARPARPCSAPTPQRRRPWPRNRAHGPARRCRLRLRRCWSSVSGWRARGGRSSPRRAQPSSARWRAWRNRRPRRCRRARPAKLGPNRHCLRARPPPRNAPTGEAGTSPISSLAPTVRRRRKNGMLRRFRWQSISQPRWSARPCPRRRLRWLRHRPLRLAPMLVTVPLPPLPTVPLSVPNPTVPSRSLPRLRPRRPAPGPRDSRRPPRVYRFPWQRRRTPLLRSRRPTAGGAGESTRRSRGVVRQRRDVAAGHGRHACRFRERDQRRVARARCELAGWARWARARFHGRPAVHASGASGRGTPDAGAGGRCVHGERAGGRRACLAHRGRRADLDSIALGCSHCSLTKNWRASARPAPVLRNFSNRSAALSVPNCTTVTSRHGRHAAVSGEWPALWLATRAGTFAVDSTN